MYSVSPLFVVPRVSATHDSCMMEVPSLCVTLIIDFEGQDSLRYFAVNPSLYLFCLVALPSPLYPGFPMFIGLWLYH